MANLIACDLVTPESLVFSGEAVLVSAPAGEGDIGMMQMCSPLMSTLRRGVIRITGEDNNVVTFAVDGGYLEVDGQKVIILASRAVDVTQIDKEFCKENIAKNEKRIAELEEESPAKAYAVGEIAWENYLLTLN
ncbi:MAG: ATP synthase F1 subunit epsilon [Coriobacteriia bacterium]|nr:ATP synthase F1 subunit epsilon [Coriobacteriia bacterium]MCL2750053.1 ATP synthase F1 subunit epsilon [Coriobacteriia bacterium]